MIAVIVNVIILIAVGTYSAVEKFINLNCKTDESFIIQVPIGYLQQQLRQQFTDSYKKSG